MKIKIILLAIFTLVIFSKSSFSDDSSLENKINKNLRCLICQGQSIYDSQSDFAESMKLVVKQKIKAGMSEEDIYSFFKIQYGEWILYDPQFNSKNFALWLLPILIFMEATVMTSSVQVMEITGSMVILGILKMAVRMMIGGGTITE